MCLVHWSTVVQHALKAQIFSNYIIMTEAGGSRKPVSDYCPSHMKKLCIFLIIKERSVFSKSVTTHHLWEVLVICCNNDTTFDTAAATEAMVVHNNSPEIILWFLQGLLGELSNGLIWIIPTSFKWLMVLQTSAFLGFSNHLQTFLNSSSKLFLKVSYPHGQVWSL